MTDIPFNRRVGRWVLWIFSGLCLLVLLTSCSSWDPFAGLPVSPTATTASTITPAAVSTETPSPTPLPYCTVATGYPAGALNLRTGPGTQYAVIRVLQETEVLTVTNAGAWLKVKDLAGARGFVNSKYCKIGE